MSILHSLIVRTKLDVAARPLPKFSCASRSSLLGLPLSAGIAASDDARPLAVVALCLSEFCCVWFVVDAACILIKLL